MTLLRPLLIAFSVYSRIPVPSIEWNERDNRLALAFLPLIGCVIAVCFIAVDALFLDFSPLLRATLCLSAVVLVTGGIHMDGFLDTCDALSSYKEREARLAILKDVHVGAFAVIRCLLLVTLLIALYAESRQPIAMSMGFVSARCGALVLLCMLPNARKSGMLNAFQGGLAKHAVLLSAVIFAAASVAIAFFFASSAALVGFMLQLIFAAIFYRKALKLFGGITGDLAGYAVTMMELCWALGLVLGGKWL